MSILDFTGLFGRDSEEMAKARPIKEDLVAKYVDRLTRAQIDGAVFDGAELAS